MQSAARTVVELISKSPLVEIRNRHFGTRYFRNIATGAGLFFMAQTGQFEHAPLIVLWPVQYGTYQTCQAGYEHRSELKSLLNRWIEKFK